LFEVEGSEGELYDYEKLSKAVGCRTELSVAELCASLIDEVKQFSATQQFNDDVCLVAMDIDRLKPSKQGLELSHKRLSTREENS
jgi:serine phosphatase RsbU (regulator of sigma subunit)